MAYEMLETRRFIEKHGLTRFKMNPHFPVNTLLVMRGLIAAEMDGVKHRYVEAVLTAMWEAGEKMDDPVRGRRGSEQGRVERPCACSCAPRTMR